jgi:hypothetical protein
MAANALAEAGHTVYASMRETTGRNAPQVQEVKEYAREHGIDLRAIELDAPPSSCPAHSLREQITSSMPGSRPIKPERMSTRRAQPQIWLRLRSKDLPR